MIKGYLWQWMIKSENRAVKDIIHCKQRAMTLEMSWMHLKKLRDFSAKILEGELSRFLVATNFAESES
jgi:hypothetical protein